MYRIDDKVSHPGHGACVVTEVCELDLTGRQVLYYKLIPCLEGCGASVYVPVKNADAIGLRPLMTKGQANSLMDSLVGATETWLSDSQAKYKRYRSLFSDNTVEGLYETISVMGAIIRRKNQKELGSTDKSMLETIQKKLVSELATVLDISLTDVMRQAEELVLQPKQKEEPLCTLLSQTAAVI